LIYDHSDKSGHNRKTGITINRGRNVIIRKDTDMEAGIYINFRKAFNSIVNGFEGKYPNDKDDPGGEILLVKVLNMYQGKYYIELMEKKEVFEKFTGLFKRVLINQ
jgi:hypothetical protein